VPLETTDLGEMSALKMTLRSFRSSMSEGGPVQAALALGVAEAVLDGLAVGVPPGLAPPRLRANAAAAIAAISAMTATSATRRRRRYTRVRLRRIRRSVR
jgi:hypothetical protein